MSDHEQTSSSTHSPWLGLRILVLAWAAFAAFQVGVVALDEGVQTGLAISYGFIMGAWMAILTQVLWVVTDRVPWPSPFRVTFLLRFIGLGFAYGVALQVYYRVAKAIRFGDPIIETLVEPPAPLFPTLLWTVFGWALLGILYGIRGHDLAQHHRIEAAEIRADLAAANTRATQARLDRLRGQLNPHFLYNALHSVNVLASHDPGAAQKAVTDLGDVLRYALATDDEWEVPFREEWAFTQQYLAIEQVRYGDKLTVTADLSDDVLSEPVPRFVLQPLVENAVRHGIAKRPDGGTIHIRASVDAPNVVVEVENEGELANQLSPDPASDEGKSPPWGSLGTHRNRIGIANLRERLSISSRDGELSLTESRPGWVLAHLTLARVED